MATKSEKAEAPVEVVLQTEAVTPAAPIPNPPGGGSWIWDGGAWLPNTGAPAAE